MSETCPGCGGPVAWYPACPGWERDGRVMVCQGCGNAAEWRCDNAPPCGWWYREPNIRRDKDQMGVRPEWFHDPMERLRDEDDDFEPIEAAR